MSLFKGLIGKLCKAANSLMFHGTLTKLRTHCTAFFKTMVFCSAVHTPDLSAEAQAYSTAAFDLAFGAEGDPKVRETDRIHRVIVSQFLNDDVRSDAPKHRLGRGIFRTIQDVMTAIPTYLTPSLVTGKCDLWNRGRWTKNRTILKVLGKMALLHRMFSFAYPRATKTKVSAKMSAADDKPKSASSP